MPLQIYYIIHRDITKLLATIPFYKKIK